MPAAGEPAAPGPDAAAPGSHGRTAEPVIRLDAVSRTYSMGESEVRALDHVDLAIEAGSFWSIMGPSGSGKSTLLGILGCLDRPTGGRYRLDGHDTRELDDDELSELRLRRLGFVFQSFHLIPQLTVRENIELPLHYLGWQREASAARAAELAALVALEHRLDHRPVALSGGERQRVAVARALANEPAVILADEPTGNLDSATSEQVMALFDRLHRERRTIVLVTHEPDIAAHATHQLRVRDGRIESIVGP